MPAAATTTTVPSQRGHAGTVSPTSSPYVTLEPTVHGKIPSDANDPADFFGIVAALVAIVVVVVVVRFAFRSRSRSSEERDA